VLRNSSVHHIRCMGWWNQGDKMNGTCRTHGGGRGQCEIHAVFWSQNLKGRDHWANLCVDGWIMLKYISKNYIGNTVTKKYLDKGIWMKLTQELSCLIQRRKLSPLNLCAMRLFIVDEKCLRNTVSSVVEVTIRDTQDESWPRYDMKACGGMEIYLHAFLTSGLDGCEWSP
jgi:hypothetical protein